MKPAQRKTASRASASSAVKPAQLETRNPELETVLLAVTGMSPAVLTETIWALAQEPEPILPTRVIVVTTADGRREMERQLFGPEPRFGGRTPWEALRAALAAAGHDLSGHLRFGTTGDDIRVITGCDPVTGRTRELADLRTPADNEAAADFLLEQVRALVENPDTRLVASLAGGRKTMGALLYACLTLVGRETDRLTHVLVNEPFDTVRGFWFPGQPGGPVTRAEGRGTRGEGKDAKGEVAFDPATARVELADVPFVPLRNLFQRELGRPAGRFGVLVESCREQVRSAAGESVHLTVEQSRCEIEVNGTRVKLAPREHLVLLFLAARAKRGDPAIGAYAEAVDPLNEFREQLRASAPPKDFSDWRGGEATKSRFDDDQDLRKAVSSLRDKLRAAGGNAHLLAPCLPEKGRFSLAVPGARIHLNV
jgi:CRISPR-associated protein (TIGR02584 family)